MELARKVLYDEHWLMKKNNKKRKTCCRAFNKSSMIIILYLKILNLAFSNN